MRVLLTGMSGTGKSTVVAELRRRGYQAYDADDDGFSEPRVQGRWGWRTDLVRQLLDVSPDDVIFFAGCSEEQAELEFDSRVLLTAPPAVLCSRLQLRASKDYGRAPAQLAQVLHDLAEIEPLLRVSADLVVDTTRAVTDIVDLILDTLGLPHRCSHTSLQADAGGPPRGTT